MTGLFFLLFTAATVSAQTNQSWSVCRHPIRVFGNRSTVDLTPLFEWWKQQPQPGRAATNRDTTADAGTGSDRPLAAWQHVTGIKAGELGSGWLVDAVIYTSPTIRTNARILLNQPPAAEEQMFYALKTQLAEAAQQITNAQRAYQADLKAAQKDDEQAAKWLRSGTKHATESYNNYLRRAGQKRDAAAADLSQQKQLEAGRPLLQKQLNAIPAKNEKYLIDWFALTLGRSKQGVLIYDLGVVPPNSP